MNSYLGRALVAALTLSFFTACPGGFLIHNAAPERAATPAVVEGSLTAVQVFVDDQHVRVSGTVVDPARTSCPTVAHETSLRVGDIELDVEEAGTGRWNEPSCGAGSSMYPSLCTNPQKTLSCVFPRIEGEGTLSTDSTKPLEIELVDANGAETFSTDIVLSKLNWSTTIGDDGVIHLNWNDEAHPPRQTLTLISFRHAPTTRLYAMLERETAMSMTFAEAAKWGDNAVLVIESTIWGQGTIGPQLSVLVRQTIPLTAQK